jgi:hypothetical protein
MSIDLWVVGRVRHPRCNRLHPYGRGGRSACTGSGARDVLQKKTRAELLRHSLARLSPEHGEVIDLVYFHIQALGKREHVGPIGDSPLRQLLWCLACRHEVVPVGAQRN